MKARRGPFLAGPAPRTIGAWLARATALYARHGAVMGQVAAEPRDEALFLILRTLDLPLDSPAAVLDAPVDAARSAALAEAFRRRLVEGEPAAYIVGEAWLGGLRFRVDPRVLIPRSYFVEIIEGQLDDWLPAPSRVRRVADVCTGSGCLAILLARHFPAAQVDGIDLSPDALEVARGNVALHRLGRRVSLLQGDVLEPVPPRRRYDVIISNPPYEPTALVDALPVEFKREPRLALDGGGDGLDIIRRLVAGAAAHLTPAGVLLIEVGGLRAAMDRAFGALEPHWLPTGDGSDCVCILHAARLAAAFPAR